MFFDTLTSDAIDLKTVLVGGVGGHIAELQVPVAATAGEVKTLLVEIVRSPVEEQHLISGEKELEDGALAPEGLVTFVRVAEHLPIGCLFDALDRQDWKRCLVILSYGYFSGINDKDDRQRTALHVAAESGRSDICLSILARNDFGEVSAKDDSNMTALHYAVSGQDVDTCCAILKRDDFTELNATAGCRTALSIASWFGYPEVAAVISA